MPRLREACDGARYLLFRIVHRQARQFGETEVRAEQAEDINSIEDVNCCEQPIYLLLFVFSIAQFLFFGPQYPELLIVHVCSIS